MRDWCYTTLINLLFRLLGEHHSRLYRIDYLFGATTSGHKARQKRWNNALVRVYKDKDLLDFLYYQMESDKEKLVTGKVRADLSRGARVRTAFIAYSAKRAYEQMILERRIRPDEKTTQVERMNELQKQYDSFVDVV